MDGGGGAGAPNPYRYRDDPDGAVRANALLRAWHAIETLTPRTYSRESDLAQGGEIVRLTGRRMPWANGRKPRKGHVDFYQVFLGAIEMDGATRRLVAAFDHAGADGFAAPGGQPSSGAGRQARAAIAAVLLDAGGRPVEDGLAVSSFAWSLPAALSGNLARLGRWAEAEQRLKSRLSGMLHKVGEIGIPPVNGADLRAAHAWIVETLDLPRDLVEPPTFASRISVPEKSRDPGAAILSSYYLDDLDRARTALERGRLPAAVRAYLGVDAPEDPVDLLADRDALARLLAPSLIPAARWPAPGGAPLVSLQQAAANAAALLAGAEGIQGVNGPPGTGKTTCLRDVVAGCVLRRAEAMCAFERPEEAFVPAAEPVDVRGRRVVPHRLDPSLRGHEVLVASANNRAVENVSRELPTLRAIDAAHADLRHFRTLSDAVAAAAADPERKGRPLPEAERTWGLSAAVFGRSANRRDFLRSFWWDPDAGLRTWLSLAAGESVRVPVKDDEGRIVGRRAPALLATEDVPRSQRQSLDRWLAARIAFREARARAAAGIERAASAARAAAAAAGADLAEVEAELDRVRTDGVAAGEAVRASGEALAWAESAEDSARRLALIVPDDGSAGAFSGGGRLIAARAEALAGETAGRRAEAEAARAAREALAGRYRDLSSLARTLRAGPDAGGRAVDAAFLAAGHEAWNRASPWLDEAGQADRAALFAAAMRVHEAFVLAAAERARSNLLAFTLASGGACEGLDAYMPDLWATLFMVTPVVSTTFASVDRMLAGLPDGALGWLVVDEAGQAPPQAALGALMRARRAIVVGDPLQVEPVTTLPDPVAARICSDLGLVPADAVAPSASVQSFADRASPFRGGFGAGESARTVGLPLLVHRRCREPMFSIANRIAYDGLMVFATPEDGAPGPVEGALGASRWIDVPPGPAGERFHAGEAAALLDVLGRIGPGEDGMPPDLFVISPFREVADAARGLVRRQKRLFGAAKVEAAPWASARIGTVHAFQGREAEAVVLLLGASGEGFHGSRLWAARTPNVLNVAVTRAKRVLYVIGDRNAWRRAGCFRALADALPCEAPEARAA